MNKGVTLVELVVVMTIAGILGLAIGSAMVAGTEMSLDARRPLGLKRDAGLALRLIGTRVRSLSPEDIEISETGDALTLQDGSEAPPFFRKVNGDFLYFDGGQTRTIIRNRVDGVSFALVEGHRANDYLLDVALQLSYDGTHAEMQSLTKLRNK